MKLQLLINFVYRMFGLGLQKDLKTAPDYAVLIFLLTVYYIHMPYTLLNIHKKLLYKYIYFRYYSGSRITRCRRGSKKDIELSDASS